MTFGSFFAYGVSALFSKPFSDIPQTQETRPKPQTTKFGSGS
jgi:hypothetical protein